MEYYIAWWNLENLFDLETSTDRPAWLQAKLKGELKGWNAAVLDQKIMRLAEVIGMMNDGKGPDVLGVCEVENEAVMQRLVAALGIAGRDYAVIHADTKDARGIDVAFIYDRKLFERPLKSDCFNHVVIKRNATRDILQVNFKTKTAPALDLVLIGNHWPSRLGSGELESEPYRILAAETLSYWLERIYHYFEGDVPVVVMGDFNDEPFDRSVTDYALGQKDSARVRSKRSRKPYLFNLMWALQNDNSGTYYYDSWSILDQFMVNRPLLRKESVLQLVDGSCGIFKPDILIKNGKPRRFGRPSKRSSYDPAGYSDHFPIALRIRTKN